MKAEWHGLVIECSIVPDEGSHGRRPDFHLEDVTWVGLDLAEFHSHHINQTPHDVWVKHQKEIYDFLYLEALTHAE